MMDFSRYFRLKPRFLHPCSPLKPLFPSCGWLVGLMDIAMVMYKFLQNIIFYQIGELRHLIP